MSQPIDQKSKSRVFGNRLIIALVVIMVAVTIIAQRPIRQQWAVYALLATVSDPTIDSARPFVDVTQAVYAVTDLDAGSLATPVLAKAFKGSSTGQQMKILHALLSLESDLFAAVPQLIEAFSDTKARDVDRDLIAKMIECANLAEAEKCGASQYLRSRGILNDLLESP